MSTAVAAPMPRLAPVISATRSVSPFTICSFESAAPDELYVDAYSEN
jgi:hypothetical protein